MGDFGRFLQWQAGIVLTEFLRNPQVHLMIHQPEGYFGDLGGELIVFDPLELIHVDVHDLSYGDHLLVAVDLFHHVQFQ